MNEKIEYRKITLTSDDEEQLKEAANISASAGRVASDKALQDNKEYTLKSARIEHFQDKNDEVRYFVDVIFADGSRCPSGCFNGTDLGDALTFPSSVCSPTDTIGQRVYKNTHALAGSQWRMLGHSTELVGKQNFRHTTWRNEYVKYADATDAVIIEEIK